MNMNHEPNVVNYGLVMVKRDWVPHWLYSLHVKILGHYLTAKPCFAWILNKKPDPFTLRRINGPGRYTEE